MGLCGTDVADSAAISEVAVAVFGIVVVAEAKAAAPRTTEVTNDNIVLSDG